MASRFPSYLAPLILACGALGSIGAQQSPGPELQNRAIPAADAIHIGRAIFSLNGPWKFQIGDSPIDPSTNAPLWAEPGFDDSHWKIVDLTPKPGVVGPLTGQPGWNPGWTLRGHPGYLGWAWYRLTISVAQEPGERIALDGPFWLDDAFQLFADGKSLGGYGRFSPSGNSVAVYSPTPVMFVFPIAGHVENLEGRPRTLTLAIRVWMGLMGMLRMPAAGGMHFAPLLGGEEAVAAQYKLDWYCLDT